LEIIRSQRFGISTPFIMHPGWDPDLELEKLSEGPIGLGTVIRRENTRYDTPTEGRMEVVDWEAERRSY